MDLTKYYDEICKHKLLSKKEEQELFNIYYDSKSTQREKDSAKAKVISANLRYVFKRAKELSKNDPGQFEDLIAAGNEGLVVGFNKYNHKSGFKFLTYAGWWVHQRQLKAMSSVRIVTLPIWKQQLSQRLTKAQENREEPLTIDELCKEFPDVPRKDIEELTKTRYLTYYFDEISDQEKTINPFEEEIDRQVEAKRIRDAIGKLPDDQAQIVMLTFGLDDGKERKAVSISREMSMTKDEVRAKRKEAFQNLRILLYGHNGD